MLLSICIPTYNRTVEVGRLLIGIFMQMDEKLKEEIEICISDNCSEVNPQDMIRTLCREYGIENITFVRNQSNLGMVENMRRVVALANGEYCWMIGSDDCVYPNMLSYVIEKVRSNGDVDIFTLPFDNVDMVANQGKRLYSTRSRVERVYDVYTEEARLDYFYHHADYEGGNQGLFCFISNIVFRRKSWLKYCNASIINVKNIYMPALVHLRTVRDGAKIMALEKPIIFRNCTDDATAIAKHNFFYDVVTGMHELIWSNFEGSLATALDKLEIPRNEQLVERFLKAEIDADRREQIMHIVYSNGM